MISRKHISLSSLGLFLVAGLVFMSFHWQPAQVYQGPPVSLYKLSAPRLQDDNTANNNAKRLLANPGANVKRAEKSKRFDNANDATEVYEQDDKGSLRFNKSLRKYTDNMNFRPSLLADNQVEAAARKFLADNNLMPTDQSELKLAHIGGLRASKAETKETIDKMKTAHFNRQIDGLPVVRPGSKMVVHLGDKGEVTGLIHRWREVDKSSKRSLNVNELKSENEAKQELFARIQKDWGKNAKSQIAAGKVGYYDSNDGYIQPVFVFETTVTPDFVSGKNEPQKYLGVISLLRNAPESVIQEELPPASNAAKTTTYDKAQDAERKPVAGRKNGDGD